MPPRTGFEFRFYFFIFWMSKSKCITLNTLNSDQEDIKERNEMRKKHFFYPCPWFSIDDFYFLFCFWCVWFNELLCRKLLCAMCTQSSLINIDFVAFVFVCVNKILILFEIALHIYMHLHRSVIICVNFTTILFAFLFNFVQLCTVWNTVR